MRSASPFRNERAFFISTVQIASVFGADRPDRFQKPLNLIDRRVTRETSPEQSADSQLFNYRQRIKISVGRKDASFSQSAGDCVGLVTFDAERHGGCSRRMWWRAVYS